MKQKIFETVYIQLLYDTEILELDYIFLETAQNMSDETYYEELVLATNQMEKYKIRNIITDFRNFSTPVVPEVQDKVIRDVVSRWIKMGLEKLALVMPTEFIATLSVEQMSDEAQKIIPYKIAYFENFDKARKWCNPKV